jgi:hypothetical protein
MRHARLYIQLFWCILTQGTFWVLENDDSVPLPGLDWEQLADMFAQVGAR